GISAMPTPTVTNRGETRSKQTGTISGLARTTDASVGSSMTNMSCQSHCAHHLGHKPLLRPPVGHARPLSTEDNPAVDASRSGATSSFDDRILESLTWQEAARVRGTLPRAWRRSAPRWTEPSKKC